MKNLIKKFQNISHQYDLWKKGYKIVVACSGGPDSTCLLDIFAKLQKKYDLELIVAHVNYGLRGKDSDLDQKLVEKYASRYNLKLAVLKSKFFSRSSASLRRSDSKKPSTSKLKLPSENQLREIRYKFFEKVRKQNKFDRIAVGHTLDDQAETYLMRIIRGAGLSGMSAMKHKNNFIIRPLLGIAKKEVLEYLKGNKIYCRTDMSNKEVSYLRNRIRNELIPILEKKYNPNIKGTLYKSSLNIAEDYEFIIQAADRISHNVIAGLTRNPDSHQRRNGNETYLKAGPLLKLHPALQKRIILEAIRDVKPSLKDIESTHINEVVKILKSAKSKRQVVKVQGLKFTRIGDKLTISCS